MVEILGNLNAGTASSKPCSQAHTFITDTESQVCTVSSIIKINIFATHPVTKTQYHFHVKSQFVHITNSSFCHVFITNTASVTFQEFENNQEYKLKHNLILTEYHNFWCMIKLFFWNGFKNLKQILKYF